MNEQTIWRLNVLADGFVSLIPQGLTYFQDHFVGHSMSDSWSGPPPYQMKSKSRKLNDFVAWHPSVPVVSEAVRDVLCDLKATGLEWLDFGELLGRPYFALNVLNFCDFVDFEKSEVFFSSPHSQGNPKRIILRADADNPPAIFKMNRVSSYVYISDSCANSMISNDLTGFGLTYLSTDVTRRALLGESLNDHPRLDSQPSAGRVKSR